MKQYITRILVDDVTNVILGAHTEVITPANETGSALTTDEAGAMPVERVRRHVPMSLVWRRSSKFRLGHRAPRSPFRRED